MAKLVDADGAGPAPPLARLWVYEDEDMVGELACAYAGSLHPAQPPAAPGACRPVAAWLHGPGVDQPVAMTRDTNGDGALSPSETLVYHADHLGSVQALTNLSGSLLASYHYDSFGNLVSVAGGYGEVITAGQLISGEWHTHSLSHVLSHNPFTYTGRELDVESGLYYYRARYYDPNSGRFLQEDPVFAGNLYGYVGNEPISYVDPLGLVSMDNKSGSDLPYKAETEATVFDRHTCVSGAQCHDIDGFVGTDGTVYQCHRGFGWPWRNTDVTIHPNGQTHGGDCEPVAGPKAKNPRNPGEGGEWDTLMWQARLNCYRNCKDTCGNDSKKLSECRKSCNASYPVNNLPSPTGGDTPTPVAGY